jgi:hypothetical protein
MDRVLSRVFAGYGMLLSPVPDNPTAADIFISSRMVHRMGPNLTNLTPTGVDDVRSMLMNKTTDADWTWASVVYAKFGVPTDLPKHVARGAKHTAALVVAIEFPCYVRRSNATKWNPSQVGISFKSLLSAIATARAVTTLTGPALIEHMSRMPAVGQV